MKTAFGTPTLLLYGRNEATLINLNGWDSVWEPAWTTDQVGASHRQFCYILSLLRFLSLLAPCRLFACLVACLHDDFRVEVVTPGRTGGRWTVDGWTRWAIAFETRT
jgi:hypothetical protein